MDGMDGRNQGVLDEAGARRLAELVKHLALEGCEPAALGILEV
jgi:hypothetical protein